MNRKIRKHLDIWQKKLLDMGMKNRLLNYKETKSSSLFIPLPDDVTLFQKLALEERKLAFPYLEHTSILDEEEGEGAFFSGENEMHKLRNEPTEIPGDLIPDKRGAELQRVLKNLRSKAKTASEEQGVNILYLAFGFLEWTEAAYSKTIIRSPLILVPVVLDVESITSPYTLSIHEDEIVVNPTLAYKLENDFAINLPEFDQQMDSLDDFFASVESKVKGAGWRISRKVALTLLSFLKINMYKDLEEHAETIEENPVVEMLCGVTPPISDGVPSMDSFDHDAQVSPSEVFQVMDADSSQMDAVELSKRGTSFVLQGPPGTGKSQTITNIIAQALADGKSVLFVSEKMAALDVVYKRLATAGLSDFCLVLHNHKANKKDLLNSLGKTLKLGEHPLSVESTAMIELRKLEEKRKKLNEYCSQLHKKIQPLNQSVFEANGIIASLEDAPYVEFDVSQIPIAQLTYENLLDLRLSVQEYAKSLGKLEEDYENNTWRNSTLQKVTYALSHNIKSRFDRLSEKMICFEDGVEAYLTDLHLSISLTINELEDFARVLSFCSQSDGFPVSWLTAEDFDGYEELFKERKEQERAHAEGKKRVEALFREEVYTLDVDSICQRLEMVFKSLPGLLNPSIRNAEAIVSESASILPAMERASKYAGELAEILRRVCDAFDIEVPDTAEKASLFCDFLRVYNQQLQADRAWFGLDKWTKPLFEQTLAEAKHLTESYTVKKQEILSVYSENILAEDLRGIHRRFKNDYSSALRFINSAYRSDTKRIKAFQKDSGQKLSFDEISTYLQKIEAFHAVEKELEERASSYRHILGAGYCGTETDFGAIEKAARRFRAVLQYLGGSVNGETRREILSGNNVDRYTHEMDEMESLLVRLEQVPFLKYYHKTEATFTEMIEDSGKIISLLREMNSELDTVKAVALPDTTREECLTGLKSVQMLMKDTEECAATESRCKKVLESLYSEPIRWEEVEEKYAWVRSFRAYRYTYHLGDQFGRALAEEAKTRDLCQSFSEFIIAFDEENSPEIQWLIELFDESENIGQKCLSEMKEFIIRCRNNLQGLEAWIDFCNAKAVCETAGLADFVQKTLAARMVPEMIERVFLKRFQYFWLDMVMPEVPAVQSFRSRNQNELIEEFRSLDTEQFRIARSRIRAMLIDKLPDIRGFTSARDEVAVLRREMEKQRKIMPVRKLFASIPNLLPRLKPCLMMSPLSVSLFLQSDNFRFDIVIFDEASQVRTENAIGAISRGKQVIIAGDIHQLPPTNFFAASLSGEDDSDEDEDDTDSFESILSEARTVLPEEELKWHYRSKNESLITFSNRKIYHNSLVTFPSPEESGLSAGVEYIYVANGIYERSGKRVNVKEAKKVVDVIFEQIRSYPNRSLGVITFSEAQMRCVENELIARRLQMPEYEPFFAENKEEAFFIKNLENVQGDERDTIILSIGYGKSGPTEQLKMNFGPVNKSGGYRRLNVAVTRAKYALKLVGSILPTDMAISDATPQGVKLLHDYIDFAQNGISVLQNQIDYTDEIHTESPFEDAVYDYLSSRGYSIATQVGCSGYRIDMAVRHPSLHGKFVVGIECDGAMYHSSRTARERDRLRQAVLESMGWRFIRIWSTDWIKDPHSEGKRVIAEIEDAISKYGIPVKKAAPAKDDTDYCTIKKSVSATRALDSRFREYKELTFPRTYFNQAMPSIARKVQQIVEEQSPVHFELICKQVAPLYGNERISSKVREGVQSILTTYSGTMGWTRKGDFIWDNHQSEIRPGVATENMSRAIDYIAVEEIARAMYILIDISYGIDKDALFDATARLFGFQRIARKISDSFETAFLLLKKQKQIKQTDGKLSLA